ncbi:zinc ABC transporter substrate-binding protein [Lewinella sp. LCG006]|uniref:metal ABC transporter solute-binding protein, Zn/Mn family n=1 Tax=Lewinella sp. LCG006 TaxID=3231911 RepID=UPI00345F25EF
MLRRLIFLVLLCAGWTLNGQTEDRLLVVASASMFADMAEVIGGNLIDVKMIVPVGGDPHIYEPTPSDVQLVTQADLVLRNGLTFEGWIDELVVNSGFTGQITTITKGINVIESDLHENSSDPHAWMSARNGLIYIQNIRDALVTLAPEYEAEFNFNYQIYRQQLEDLDQEIEEILSAIPRHKRILITSHDAFRYFGRRYGVQVEAVLGTSTDADVQTSDIRRLTRVLQESEVPALFIESTINPKLLKVLAKDNNVIIGGSLYADSLGEKDGPAGTYLDMLRHNAHTIAEGLSLDKQTLNHQEEEENTTQNYLLFGFILLIMAGSFFFMVAKLNT